MSNKQIVFDTKLVGDITGNFYVPSYQRGYRWGREEVLRLLEDIDQNGDNSYCLQPIVVRKAGNSYELIDGQQRLTTIPLLIECRIKQLIDEGQKQDHDITEANSDYFNEFFDSGQMEEWVCEEGGRIIATGAIIYYAFPPSFTNGEGVKAYITNIYTDPEFRGRGIAPKMLALLEKRARARNVSRIWLEASKWGKPVYEKYGFAENDTIMTIEI